MGNQVGRETVGCLWQSSTGCYKHTGSCCPGNSLSFRHDHRSRRRQRSREVMTQELSGQAVPLWKGDEECLSRSNWFLGLDLEEAWAFNCSAVRAGDWTQHDLQRQREDLREETGISTEEASQILLRMKGALWALWLESIVRSWGGIGKLSSPISWILSG